MGGNLVSLYWVKVVKALAGVSSRFNDLLALVGLQDQVTRVIEMGSARPQWLECMMNNGLVFAFNSQ